MDAERIAGDQETGRQATTGRQRTTGSQETGKDQDTGNRERAATAVAVPNQRGELGRTADAVGVERIDVRCEPLAVRDGCSPGRIPAGRWPSDDPLVRSEQFAVNEAMAQRGLFAVHGPADTGVAEVFGNLVAAIVTERARRIADLPSPSAAFGDWRTWSGRRVAIPNPALTGFEIVLAAPEPSALTAHGLPPIGARWRAAGTETDYFASTARLSDGVGAWAMLAARLGDAAVNRSFAERWWRGVIRGTDVLFPGGESMAAALRRLRQAGPAADWMAAVARFRAALARAETLACERSGVAAAVTRISDLEQACEEASGLAETAQARLAAAASVESDVRATLAAAEEEHRARLAALGAHELGRPTPATITPTGKAALRSPAALSIALAGGLRRGRNWREWSVTRRKLRAACAVAETARAAAADAAAAIDATLAAARSAATATAAEVARLTAEIGPLAEEVAAARQLWGDHVPDGPSQAETEDATLIEWRETSAPWADDEYSTARAEVFLAALDLHKALVVEQADVFAANLGALMDLLSADQDRLNAAAPSAGGTVETVTSGIAAAWQSLFLLVPVVHVPFGAIGALFADLGEARLGWLLANHGERLPAWQARAVLGLVDCAVFAGDSVATEMLGLGRDLVTRGACSTEHAIAADGAVGAESTVTAESAQRLAERTSRYGTWLRSGRMPSAGTARRGEPAGQSESTRQPDSAERIWVGTPLRVVRGLDRTTIDLRNDLGYDGLLVSNRD